MVGDIDQTDVVDIKEAILQRRIDMVGQRRTNAGQALIGEARVRVVQEVAEPAEAERFLDASDTDTTADEALDAVVVDRSRAGRSP